jgi:hypothetical protein
MTHCLELFYFFVPPDAAGMNWKILSVTNVPSGSF